MESGKLVFLHQNCIIQLFCNMTETEKKPYKMKYENSVRVSYPKSMYLKVRSVSVRLGVSIQDVQRMAMDHFLNEKEKEITHV